MFALVGVIDQLFQKQGRNCKYKENELIYLLGAIDIHGKI